MQVTDEMIDAALDAYDAPRYAPCEKRMRAALEAALGAKTGSDENIAEELRDQEAWLYTLGFKGLIELHDRAADCIEELAAALKEIIQFDRAEKRMCIEFDPAGCTYEVEDIDGPHADRARATLERWGLK